MAFKLSKTDQTRINKLIEQFNERKDAVQTAIDALNETRDELRGVVEDIRDEMQSEFDDRSEAWLEGDRAGPTEDWINTLGEFVGEVENEIEMPDMSDIEEKLEEGVPSAPEY